jgi:hypothetical protein
MSTRNQYLEPDVATMEGWRITAFKDRHDNVWEVQEPYVVEKLRLRGATGIRKDRRYLEVDDGPLIPVEVDNVAGLLQGYRKAIEWTKELQDSCEKLRKRLRLLVTDFRDDSVTAVNTEALTVDRGQS